MEEAGFTVDELMCACIARQVRNGEVVVQGLATPLVAAGYLLAWRTHAPGIYFASAIGQSICREGAAVGLSYAEALWADQAMISFGFVQAAADLLPRLRPKEFFRPAQVDACGNFNNVAFGRSYEKPRLRLPGTGGIPDVTPVMSEIHLYVPRHSRLTFTPRLDFMSGLGHHHARKRGHGPRYLVSDLGQFDFAEGRMRLTHTHPGVEVAQVQARTGFVLEVSSPLCTTEPPSREETRILREEIDPLGVRRLEFLAGAERKRVLVEILQQENSAVMSGRASGRREA